MPQPRVPAILCRSTASLAAALALLVPPAAPAAAQPGILGSQKGKPSQLEPKAGDVAPPAADTAESTSIAILPFASLLDGQGEVLANQLTGFVTREFTAQRPQLRVLDRTQDGALKREMQRVQSEDQFESAVRVAQGRGTNARFLLAGLLMSGRVDSAVTNDVPKRWSYTVTLGFRVGVHDVQNHEVVCDSTFTISSADHTRSRGGAQAEFGVQLRRQAVDIASRFFDGKGDREAERRRAREQRGKTRTSDIGAMGQNFLRAFSPQEALDRAMRSADRRVTDFARSVGPTLGAPAVSER